MQMGTGNSLSWAFGVQIKHCKRAQLLATGDYIGILGHGYNLCLLHSGQEKAIAFDVSWDWILIGVLNIFNLLHDMVDSSRADTCSGGQKMHSGLESMNKIGCL